MAAGEPDSMNLVTSGYAIEESRETSPQAAHPPELPSRISLIRQVLGGSLFIVPGQILIPLGIAVHVWYWTQGSQSKDDLISPSRALFWTGICFAAGWVISESPRPTIAPMLSMMVSITSMWSLFVTMAMGAKYGAEVMNGRVLTVIAIAMAAIFVSDRFSKQQQPPQ